MRAPMQGIGASAKAARVRAGSGPQPRAPAIRRASSTSDTHGKEGRVEVAPWRLMNLLERSKEDKSVAKNPDFVGLAAAAALADLASVVSLLVPSKNAIVVRRRPPPPPAQPLKATEVVELAVSSEASAEPEPSTSGSETSDAAEAIAAPAPSQGAPEGSQAGYVLRADTRVEVGVVEPIGTRDIELTSRKARPVVEPAEAKPAGAEPTGAEPTRAEPAEAQPAGRKEEDGGRRAGVIATGSGGALALTTDAADLTADDMRVGPMTTVGACVIVTALAGMIDAGVIATVDPYMGISLRLLLLSASVCALLTAIAGRLRMERAAGAIAVVCGATPGLLWSSLHPVAILVALPTVLASCLGFLEDTVAETRRERFTWGAHAAAALAVAASVTAAAVSLSGSRAVPVQLWGPQGKVLSLGLVPFTAICGALLAAFTGTLRAAGGLVGVRPGVLSMTLMGAECVVASANPFLLPLLVCLAGADLGVAVVGSTTGAVVGPSGSLAAGAALAAAAIFSGLLPSMAVLALGVAAQAAVASKFRARAPRAVARHAVSLAAVYAALCLARGMWTPVVA